MHQNIIDLYENSTIQEINESIENAYMMVENILLTIRNLHLIIEKKRQNRQRMTQKEYQKQYYQKRKRVRNKLEPFSLRTNYNNKCGIVEEKFILEF